MVAAEEVTAVLRRMLTTTVDGHWNHWGDVKFLCAGWKVTLFVDDGELDYVDAVTADDGRCGDYDDWVVNPLWLLSAAERDALKTRLEPL